MAYKTILFGVLCKTDTKSPQAITQTIPGGTGSSNTFSSLGNVSKFWGFEQKDYSGKTYIGAYDWQLSEPGWAGRHPGNPQIGSIGVLDKCYSEIITG